MIRIIANDGIESSAKAKLESLGYEVDTNHYEGEELHKQIRECEVFIVRSATKVRKDLIDIAIGGRLKLIIRAGVGIDNIDHVYASEKGFTVRNTPNSSSASVAELAIAHMFALSRFINIANVTMRQGKWEKKHYTGFELAGKTLGLIGFGRIAQETAKKAHALGMKVVYNKRSGADTSFPEYTFMELDELLASSNFVSLHLPWSKGQRPILGLEELRKMKKGSYVINTARGGAVDEDALVTAIEEGHLAGAGIDVFLEEPTKNEALYMNDKVSVTPHIGGSTKEAQERIGEETIGVITEFFN